MQFCRAAGWEQVQADWQRLVDYQPDGCFAAFQGERLVGTVTTTSYGQELAWIGMVLVDPDYRRQGIATALMRRAVAILRERGVKCVKLDATPEGEFVYKSLGFKPEFSFNRWKRSPAASSDSGRFSLVATTVNSSLTSSMIELDRRAFGVDRMEYLKRLCLDSSLTVRDSGFGMLRQGFQSDYLGPICAEDSTTSESIVQELVSRTKADLIWDIPSENSDAVKIAEDVGFVPVRSLKRMYLGTPGFKANYALQYALADPATG